jgi:hypothetical protein
VKFSPVGSSDPGSASTAEPASISIAEAENAASGPRGGPSVGIASVKVTVPKSASEASEHLTWQISGRSTIRSADDCAGGGDGEAMLMEKFHFLPSVAQLKLLA